MATCTFFGHKDTPQQANPILRAVLIDLIENKNVNMFYVGNHGNFDYMVRGSLKFYDKITHLTTLTPLKCHSGLYVLKQVVRRVCF